MIRRYDSLFLLAVPLLLAGCGGALRSQQPAPQWTTGFWLWRGSPPLPAPAGLTLDVLYFQAGEISSDQYVYGSMPDTLPPAREYWMVFRFDRQGFPSPSVVPLLMDAVARLRTAARERHLNLAGIQVDIDSPSGSLRQYAQVLHEVRKALPPELGLSITALLDWFHYDVGSVIKEVDEFVPQFYDAQSRYEPRAPIDAALDAAKWGPILNSFGKRFRIGIATFGRASAGPAFSYADLAPIDVASNPAFALETSHNTAGEPVLTYRATRNTSLGYNRVASGQSIQFILPSTETVRAAVQAARRIGGSCAGVLFFRWPTLNEVLTMDPSDVLAAAGVGSHLEKPQPAIELVTGSCATVTCADLYFLNAPPLNPAAVRYRIHPSANLEYFVPEQHIPARMSGSSDLEFSLPRYGGRRRILLGRAVSKTPVQFTVQALP